MGLSTFFVEWFLLGARAGRMASQGKSGGTLVWASSLGAARSFDSTWGKWCALVPSIHNMNWCHDVSMWLLACRGWDPYLRLLGWLSVLYVYIYVYIYTYICIYIYIYLQLHVKPWDGNLTHPEEIAISLSWAGSQREPTSQKNKRPQVGAKKKVDRWIDGW